MSDETLPQPPEAPEAPAGPYVYDYAASPQRQVVMPKTVPLPSLKTYQAEVKAAAAADEAKWVIAMGSCATAGGPFDSYHTIQGVDKVIPVDVFIPGCPPKPESLIYGFLKLQDKIMTSSIADRYKDIFEEVG